MVARGYGIAAFENAELAPDDAKRYRDGCDSACSKGARSAARPKDAWAAIAAWAWGARRAMDYFETEPRIDRTRVAVVGHSRGGKAALWAGAEDERFALVVSNESGEGGAALSRRQFGETVERLTTTFPHWFAANYSGFARREDALPIDQHMLLALVAPRLLYVASADEDLWSDPRGEFLSLAARVARLRPLGRSGDPTRATCPRSIGHWSSIAARTTFAAAVTTSRPTTGTVSPISRTCGGHVDALCRRRHGHGHPSCSIGRAALRAQATIPWPDSYETWLAALGAHADAQSVNLPSRSATVSLENCVPVTTAGT